jgi:hypothetical protein
MNQPLNLPFRRIVLLLRPASKALSLIDLPHFRFQSGAADVTDEMEVEEDNEEEEEKRTSDMVSRSSRWAAVKLPSFIDRH